MKKLIPALFLIPTLVFAADKSPDEGFYNKAAEGGITEVELGKLVQEKAHSKAVKDFGARMVKDHSAANERLKAIALRKGIDLPTKPGLTQMATKAKLEILSGETFDNSYVKYMVKDHEADIKEFEKEAREGKDAEAKAFATATLPTLREHLKHIRSVAASTGVKVD